jgi:hypothetical protein
MVGRIAKIIELAGIRVSDHIASVGYPNRIAVIASKGAEVGNGVSSLGSDRPETE